MFNLTIKDKKWIGVFMTLFDNVYFETKNKLHEKEYIQLQVLLKQWVELCISNTQNYETPIDKNDLYDEYQMRFKFPKYIANANVTVFRTM